MVGPRYDYVRCMLGRGLVRQYAGGCVIDFAEEFERKSRGDRCDCNPGECKAEDDNPLIMETKR